MFCLILFYKTIVGGKRNVREFFVLGIYYAAEEDRGKGDKQNETATRMEASALPSLPDGNLIQQQPRELRERDAKDVCCTQIQGTPYIKYLCRNLENEEVTHACVMVKIAEEKPQKVILPIEDCCNYSKLHRHFKLLGKLSAKIGV